MASFSTLIGLICSLLGVLGYVVKLAVDYSKLKSEVKELKSDLLQYKKELENKINDIMKDVEEIRNNIKELYEFRYTTGQALTEVSTTLKMLSNNINQQFKNLEDKIDQIGKKKND